jgi:hypothetical protein
MKTAAAVAMLAAVVASGPARAEGQADIYRAMGIRPEGVLSGTVIQARVLSGAHKQTVAMVTYLTGKKEDAEAVGIRLAVFKREGEKLRSVYERDFASENKGFVGRGEIELVDLDGDGRTEIVATWDNARSRVIEERRGEVVMMEGDAFVVAWAGAMSYDATKAAREVPQERRDRYERSFDIAATLRTRGITLFVTKKLTHVAGERLPEPRIVRETFPLRAPLE